MGQLTPLTCVMTCWKYKHKGTILTRFSNWRWHWMAVSYSNRKIYTIFRVSKHRSFEQGRSCWGYIKVFWVKIALEVRLFSPNRKKWKIILTIMVIEWRWCTQVEKSIPFFECSNTNLLNKVAHAGVISKFSGSK